MGLAMMVFEFEGDAPPVERVRECAESMGGLPVQIETFEEGMVMLSFPFIDGTVSIESSGQTVSFRSYIGEAEVLMTLLAAALAELGGEARVGTAPELPALPLKEDEVIAEMRALRRDINKISYTVLAVAAGFGVVALICIVWLLRAIWGWLA